MTNTLHHITPDVVNAGTPWLGLFLFFYITICIGNFTSYTLHLDPHYIAFDKPSLVPPWKKSKFMYIVNLFIPLYVLAYILHGIKMIGGAFVQLKRDFTRILNELP